MSQQLSDQIIHESVKTVVEHSVVATCNAYALKKLFETGSVTMHDYEAMKSTANALLTEGAMDFVPEDVNVEVPVGVEAPAVPADAGVEGAPEDLSHEDIEGIILPVQGSNQLMEIVNGELVPYVEEGEAAPADAAPAPAGETGPVEESTKTVTENTVNTANTATIANAAVAGEQLNEGELVASTANVELVASTEGEAQVALNEGEAQVALNEGEVAANTAAANTDGEPATATQNSEGEAQVALNEGEVAANTANTANTDGEDTTKVESLNENSTYTDQKASSIVAGLLADAEW